MKYFCVIIEMQTHLYNNGTLFIWEELDIYHGVIVLIKIFCMNGDSENLIKSKKIKKVSVR